MPIDTSIYGQIEKPISPLAQYAQIQQIQNSQNQNRLSELAFSKDKRELDQTNALNDAYKSSLSNDGSIDRAKLYSNVAQGGYGSALPGIQKNFQDFDKSQADTVKTKSETQKYDIDNAIKQFDAIGQTMGALSGIPGGAKPAHIQNAVQHMVDVGLVRQDKAQSIIDKIPQDQTQITPWLQSLQKMAMSAKDQVSMTTPDANARLTAQTSRDNSIRTDNRQREVVQQKQNNTKLPTAALKMQQEELDAIAIASSLNADLSAISDQIRNKTLNLGLVNNLVSAGKNYTGNSDKSSQNYATFQATLEKLRNDSLRLNKGVQTEGDSVRAWNELVKNINDPDVVSQRLSEIQKINERASHIRSMNVDNIRSNYGLQPLDTSGYSSQPPAIGNADAGARPTSPLPAAGIPKTQNRKTVGGQNFVQINGQWYHE